MKSYKPWTDYDPQFCENVNSFPDAIEAEFGCKFKKPDGIVKRANESEQIRNTYTFDTLDGN